MAKRSPILGYNHNIRHRGLVFHVQSEDSGLSNPHLFTHLFHGGVIISTRKLVYDADASEDLVKGLMQAQHKAVLKDLKEGKFTDKINQYLGSHPDLLPFDPGESASSERTEPMPKLSVEELDPDLVAPPLPPLAVSDDATEPMVMPRAEDTKREKAPSRPRTPTAEVVQIHSPAPPSAPEPPGLDKGGSYAQHRHRKGDSSGSVPTVTFTPVAEPPPVAKPQQTQPLPPPATRSGSRAVPQPSAAGKSGGVVVSRPAVIVGAPPRVVGGTTKDTQRRGKTEGGGPGARKPETLFGQGLISEKSLDEVILAYLSEDGDEE